MSDRDIPALRRKLLDVTSYTRPIMAGGVLLIAFGLVFGGGAAYAPIEGAAVAAGNFVARGQNQKIQHLEGGIVAEILVNEGDLVRRDDVLIRLDITQAQAELRRLTNEFNSGSARLARLLAERERKARIAYPDWLLERARRDRGIALLMADQDMEFAARQESRATQISILEQKIKAAEAEIEGYRAQARSLRESQALLDEEMAALDTLQGKGLMGSERIFRTRRELVENHGRQGQIAAVIGTTELTIQENRGQIAKLHKEGVEEAAIEVVDLRLQLGKTAAEIETAQDIIRRSEVTAPTDGIVVTRHVNTLGSVLAPGGEVVELLPQPADLVIEVEVMPADIDRVHPGQKAAVQVAALDIPYAPMMPGTVEYVSADRTIDEAKDKEYYIVRISDVALPDDVDDSRIYPGMQVEAFIETGSRTFAQYLFEPLWLGFRRSLREK